MRLDAGGGRCALSCNEDTISCRRANLGAGAFSANNRLVLVRHGESTWNDEGLFTGWYDCPLSVKGRLEAFQSGELLKAEGFGFDLAYTSMLKRTFSGVESSA